MVRNENSVSYATNRKIKIIEEAIGPNWRERYSEHSVDAVYNIVIGDKRKNLFCKVNPDVKSKLDEMVDYYDISMAEMIERLVLGEYDDFITMREAKIEAMATQFGVKQ